MVALRFSLDVSGLRDLSRGVRPALERLVTARARAATTDMVAALRADVVAGGLGPRVANAWRGRVYPLGQESANAAGHVTTNAEDIVHAFNEGVTIRGRDGNWLAIPTPNAPMARRNSGGGVKGGRTRATPREVEAMYNTDLQLVKRPGGTALLVMPRAVRARGGRGFRPATAGRVRQGRAADAVVMFFLVRQVRLGRRLDYGAVFDQVVAGWEAGLRADVERLGEVL